MNIIKRIFRKPAIIFVTLWAKRTFNQGVKAAEGRRLDEIRRGYEEGNNCMIYLACNSFRPDHLVTYTKRQFKVEKRVYGVAARLLTMNTLKRGCYYYTADRWGNGGISAKDLEIRKKAFIKERLQKAKLI
jgi:hypothetical protein